jgi:hypothetical protein
LAYLHPTDKPVVERFDRLRRAKGEGHEQQGANFLTRM